MIGRESNWRAFAASLCLAGPVLALPQQSGANGLRPAGKPPAIPAPPEVDVPRPEPATPSGRPGALLPRAEAEERIVPDAGVTSWRMWLARNFHSFEPPPLDLADAHPGLAPHQLDPTIRAQNRGLYAPEVDARLGLLLRDPDDRVRGAAAIAFARSGFADDANDCQALLDMLGDDQRRVRDQALLATSLADGTASRYHLLRFASSEDDGAGAATDSERVRARTLAALFASLRGEPSLLRIVRDLAVNRRLTTQWRALAVQSIGLSGNRDATALLIDLARDRAEPATVRAAAVTALGALGDRTAAPFVVSLLEDRDHDSDVRAAAALAAGELVSGGDADLARALVRAHDREGNALIARFLLLSLGRIGGPHAEVEILRVLQRESAEERVFAELALGLVARSAGTPQKIEPLLDLLREVRIQDERCAILYALGLSALPQALEAVTKNALEEGAPEVRRAAIGALHLIGRTECLAVFQRLLLDDESPEVRMQAARALARIDPGSANTLVHALGSGRSRGTSERAALILCLGFTRDPGALEPLLKLLRERGHPSQEREAATMALGLVYDGERLPPAARIGIAKSFLRESAEVASLLALTE